MPRTEAIESLTGLPRFASVVAHELRNPLSAVKIALQTLERHAGLQEKDATRLAIALREVATIERVLTDILDWARPPELAPHPVAAGDIVDAAVALAQPDLSEARVRLVRDAAGDARRVLADAPRAARALAELIRNAAQASPPDGRVQLSLRPVDGRSVALEVRDDGPGLTDEEAARAFEPFFTRRARGVGLGLTRARELARRLGGDVHLEPAPGGGAAARLELLAAEAGP